MLSCLDVLVVAKSSENWADGDREEIKVSHLRKGGEMELFLSG